MKDVYTVCSELMSSNSRNFKEKVLTQELSNQAFRQALCFLLNPFIITGISTKRIEKHVNTIPSVQLKTLDEVLHYLEVNKSGRDADVAVVQHFIQSQVGQEDFYMKLLTKELKLGITAKTVNKVYGKGFIPEWDVMTAEKYHEHPDWVKGKSFAITNKIDGNRCIVLKNGDEVTMWAGRSGQVLEGFTEIEGAICSLPADVVVLDGELTLRETAGLTSVEQYQKATSIIRKKGAKTGVKLIVFDMPSYDEFFVTHAGKIPYAQRRCIMEALLPNTKETDLLYVLPTLYMGSDTSQIQKWKEWAIETQNEGVMINILDAPYQFKRTKDILKVKVQEDSDLEVIGFEEGKKTGKFSGTLGAIVVEYKGGSVSVGGGLSEALRDEIWNNREKWLHRVIAVKHNGETVDTATGQVSLRFPRFKELREEGKEVNY